jgi:hypothetical protein
VLALSERAVAWLHRVLIASGFVVLAAMGYAEWRAWLEADVREVLRGDWRGQWLGRPLR